MDSLTRRERRVALNLVWFILIMYKAIVGPSTSLSATVRASASSMHLEWTDRLEGMGLGAFCFQVFSCTLPRRELMKTFAFQGPKLGSWDMGNILQN